MVNKLKEVVIVSAVRTPIGTYKGSLKKMRSNQLGSIVIKEVLKKSKFDNDEVDEVIMGQVLTAGEGQNPARQAAVNAGIPISKPAYIVNQVCGSGLRAVISGFQSIKLGESKNVISGGQENMSKAPHAIYYRENKKLSKEKMIDTSDDDFTWSTLSEENRDEWKLKNLTQSAWDEIEKVDSVLSSPTVWNSMSSRERYDWKNKYIKQRDDWISRSLKRLTGDSYEP